VGQYNCRGALGGCCFGILHFGILEALYCDRRVVGTEGCCVCSGEGVCVQSNCVRTWVMGARRRRP